MLRRSSLLAVSAAALLLSLTGCVVHPVAEPAPAAAAAAPVATAPAENTAAAPDGEDIQCKTVYNTGSRLDKKKVCTTAAERERAAAAAKDFVDHSSRSSNVMSGQ